MAPSYVKLVTVTKTRVTAKANTLLTPRQLASWTIIHSTPEWLDMIETRKIQMRSAFDALTDGEVMAAVEGNLGDGYIGATYSPKTKRLELHFLDLEQWEIDPRVATRDHFFSSRRTNQMPLRTEIFFGRRLQDRTVEWEQHRYDQYRGVVSVDYDEFFHYDGEMRDVVDGLKEILDTTRQIRAARRREVDRWGDLMKRFVRQQGIQRFTARCQEDFITPTDDQLSRAGSEAWNERRRDLERLDEVIRKAVDMGVTTTALTLEQVLTIEGATVPEWLDPGLTLPQRAKDDDRDERDDDE